jgi:hypothetical protein
VPKLELAELPGGRIEGRLTYNEHAFAEDTVGHLADDLMELAAGATFHRHQRLSEWTGARATAGSNR